jgi:hypothetical protein
MVSFDLQDAYRCVSIVEEDQKYMSFCVDGEYFVCSALALWLHKFPIRVHQGGQALHQAHTGLLMARFLLRVTSRALGVLILLSYWLIWMIFWWRLSHLRL